MESYWPKLASLLKLENMQNRDFCILPFLSFTLEDWYADRHSILTQIDKKLLGSILIVRSCAFGEDGNQAEPPGFFDTVMDVPFNDTTS